MGKRHQARPGEPITRAEFASVIARHFKIARPNDVEPLEIHFSDIADSWARSTIEEAACTHEYTGSASGGETITRWIEDVLR